MKMKVSIIKDRMVYLFLALGLMLKLPFAEKVFSYVDGVQYGLALERYSIKDYLPAPPGRFLYVMAAKFLNMLFQDAHTSFIAINILVSVLACIVFYRAGRHIFDKKTGIISGILLLVSPAFWYYSGSAFAYPVNGMFAFLTGYCCYKAVIDNERSGIILASFFFAIMLGVREQDVFFVLLPWLWALWKSPGRMRLAGFLVFVLTLLCWWLPLVWISGGLREYFQVIFQALSGNEKFLLASNIRMLKNNIKFIFNSFLLTFGLGTIFLIYFVQPFFGIKSVFLKKQNRFFLVWIIPNILYWMIYPGNNTGYLVSSIYPLTLVTAKSITAFAEELCDVLRSTKFKFRVNSGHISSALLGVIVITNSLFFLRGFHPDAKVSGESLYQSFSNYNKRDNYLLAKFKLIKENFSARDCVIVAGQDFFMQVMYYLPEYMVYGISKLDQNTMDYRHAYQHKIENIIGAKPLDPIPVGVKQIIFFDDNFSSVEISGAVKDIFAVGEDYKLTVFFLDAKTRLLFEEGIIYAR